jgi:hypothetical protein
MNIIEAFKEMRSGKILTRTIGQFETERSYYKYINGKFIVSDSIDFNSGCENTFALGSISVDAISAEWEIVETKLKCNFCGSECELELFTFSTQKKMNAVQCSNLECMARSACSNSKEGAIKKHKYFDKITFNELPPYAGVSISELIRDLAIR